MHNERKLANSNSKIKERNLKVHFDHMNTIKHYNSMALKVKIQLRRSASTLLTCTKLIILPSLTLR